MFRDRDGWRVQWREPNGKRRSRKFQSKADARVFEIQLELGTAETRGGERSTPTFAAFAARWLETVCKTEKAKSQWAKDEEVIRLHLVPAFGEVRLSALTKSHLIRLKADLRQKRAKSNRKRPREAGEVPPKLLSAKTANLVLALAKRIMATAVDLDLVAENPFAKVKLYRLAERPTLYWSREERDRFLSEAAGLDPEFTRLVAVAVHTGLRLGELAGLRRADLDFEARTITVERSYSVTLQEVTPTKGKEVGLVPMNAVVVTALEPARFLRREDWVFGRALFWSARKRLGRLARKVGVAPIRFHDLRHGFASLLAEQGVSLLQIQKLLRHKSPQMTLRYAKLSHQNLAGVTDLLCLPGTRDDSQALERSKSGGPRGT
jgi:integrase